MFCKAGRDLQRELNTKGKEIGPRIQEIINRRGQPISGSKSVRALAEEKTEWGRLRYQRGNYRILWKLKIAPSSLSSPSILSLCPAATKVKIMPESSCRLQKGSEGTDHCHLLTNAAPSDWQCKPRDSTGHRASHKIS